MKPKKKRNFVLVPGTGIMVNFNKIRNVVIYERTMGDTPFTEVIAWYNENENVYLGSFETKNDAVVLVIWLMLYLNRDTDFTFSEWLTDEQAKSQQASSPLYNEFIKQQSTLLTP